MIGLENPSLPQPALTSHQLPKQYVKPELQEYLIRSSEDETVINSVEWLLRECTTNRQVMKMDALKPILTIINPRETIIKAIYNLKQQSVTTEGSVTWEKNEGRSSKSGQVAVDKLTLAITSISKIEDDKEVKQEIKTATTCLLNHLEILKSTLNSLSTTNREKINKATSGTLSVPHRSLSAIIETIPIFSGDDSPEAVSWLDFHIAVQPLELHNFNKKDSVIQFLTKIQNPARRMITTQDKETSVPEIFQKLKAIFGTPNKVCAKVISEHFRIGSIPELDFSCSLAASRSPG